jgi:DNA phosphorothioation-associated putative methyltransferase
LGYVINVIESETERIAALKEAWRLTRQLLIVSVRVKADQLGADLVPYRDGYLSSRGTFQKFYDHGELRELLASALTDQIVPAGPGMFYVFRQVMQREAFLVYQYRRRSTDTPTVTYRNFFDTHRELFRPVIAFSVERGRLPGADEVPEMTRLSEIFGHTQRVLSVVRRVIGPEHWDNIRLDRTDDLLVYLALARFGNRPRLHQLPSGVRRDVLALCRTYKSACRQADDLLFSAGDQTLLDRACRLSHVGKLTPTALYLHESAVNDMLPILRVYEGCARRYIGNIAAANIVKLHRYKAQVSYLSYPGFEHHPHPALTGAVVVPLTTFHVKYYDYTHHENPPILHRKETFVPSTHPMRKKFERLTRKEESLGLFRETTLIGRRNHWQALLATQGIELRGHRVVRRLGTTSSD